MYGIQIIVLVAVDTGMTSEIPLGTNTSLQVQRYYTLIAQISQSEKQEVEITALPQHALEQMQDF